MGVIPPCVSEGPLIGSLLLYNELPGSCPALSPTENLHYNSTATYPGASVTATCDYGFFLRGSFTLQCVIGSWSDSPPTCIRTQGDKLVLACM